MQNVNLSINELGCLRVRSRAVAESYLPTADACLGAGQFQTSDLAEITDGLVYLRGRAGDVINVAGRKVSPISIEQALNQHPSVSASLVFGVPGRDAERGDTIVACVETRRTVAAETLRQFLLARLDAWQVPREWWFVDSLATGQRGKISRAEWRKRFLDRH